jgi:hypothetical protein
MMALVAASASFGRGSGRPILDLSTASPQSPQISVAEHNIANMALTVTNKGQLGNAYHAYPDCFTGLPVRNCEYPIGSRQYYLFSGAFWVGGVVGDDTLVSVGVDGWDAGQELNPDNAPLGGFRYRSTLSSLSQYRDSAVSHQDFLATYWDTCVTCIGVRPDPVDHRPHRPLGLRVDQRSYAWNYPYAADFVIFDLTLTNVLSNQIRNAYFGVYVDADVYANGNGNGYLDDVTGFIPSETIPGTACAASVHAPLAWIADNDGDLSSQQVKPVPNVTGTALLRAPVDSMAVSFNWWVSNGDPSEDFGPMRKANMRDFGTGGTGTPTGDRNKYWLLRNSDIDYDQVFTATISSDDSVWMFPTQLLAPDLARGFDTRYLLSVGPFDLDPGQSVPLVFAYVGGKDLHTDPTNLQNLPADPWRYYQHLNFTNLKNNAVYASWVYDNPGVDTDSDGYAGQFTVCDSDTVWTTGDGVPDFRAAFPPPRPQIAVKALSERLLIRWNGLASETTPDPFSRKVDFEGYNVYLRRLGETNWQRIANYDLDSYFKMVWDLDVSGWRPQPYAMTLSALRCRYAQGGCTDSSWSPNNYSRSAPFVLPSASDSIFYFVPVGCNSSRFGLETAIEKTYPLAPKPRWSRPEDVPSDSAELFLTAEGRFRYYEYQMIVDGLLSGETYQVNVTATDYGPAFSDAAYPLESSPNEGFVTAVPLSINCCTERTGNIDCDPANQVDIADLAALIDHLFISLDPLCCPVAANVDGDAEGGVDLSDLTRLIDYLYINFTPPEVCR